MPARRLRSILSAALVLAALLWLALALPPATAHGILERSDPVSSAAVDVPPRQVVLWFSEPVAPAFTSATVTDDQGRRVSRDAALSTDTPRAEPSSSPWVRPYPPGWVAQSRRRPRRAPWPCAGRPSLEPSCLRGTSSSRPSYCIRRCAAPTRRSPRRFARQPRRGCAVSRSRPPFSCSSARLPGSP